MVTKTSLALLFSSLLFMEALKIIASIWRKQEKRGRKTNTVYISQECPHANFWGGIYELHRQDLWAILPTRQNIITLLIFFFYKLFSRTTDTSTPLQQHLQNG